MNLYKTYLLLNGPNLDMLGLREPEIYGSETLADIENNMRLFANKLSVALDCKQSNHEGVLIDIIHEASEKYSGIIFNPGAFTHYSYAIYDALLSVDTPCVEVHLSNVYSRENFRKASVTRDACVCQISGAGAHGYEIALEGLELKGWSARIKEGMQDISQECQCDELRAQDLRVIVGENKSAKENKSENNTSVCASVSA